VIVPRLVVVSVVVLVVAVGVVVELVVVGVVVVVEVVVGSLVVDVDAVVEVVELVEDVVSSPLLSAATTASATPRPITAATRTEISAFMPPPIPLLGGSP
jgi:hypothetical protein